jgi:iron transport multicopper oxidase
MLLTPRRTLVALLTFVLETFAAIGPVTNLRISNAVIAPDGFSRS